MRSVRRQSQNFGWQAVRRWICAVASPSSRVASITSVWMAVAALIFSQGGGLWASEAMRKELGPVAKSIHALLDEEAQTAVAIGDFTGPAQLDSNFGPGIANDLSDELTSLKVTIDKKASLSVKGRYALVEDKKKPELRIVKLTIQVLDRNDDVKSEYRAEVRDNTTIAQVSGATVALSPKADKETRNAEIQKAIDNPTVHVSGTKVSATKESQFLVELLVKSEPGGKGIPRAPVIEDGQAVVEIKRDEYYEIRIYNEASHETAVEAVIDGLNVFAFSDVKDENTEKTKYKYYILDPKKPSTIVGWHRTNQQSDSFVVTEYGKGASAKGQVTSGKTGVITITFAACSDHPEDLPTDDGARNASSNETGFGPPIRTDVQEVKRTIGAVREIVSIRYSR